MQSQFEVNMSGTLDVDATLYATLPTVPTNLVADDPSGNVPTPTPVPSTMLFYRAGSTFTVLGTAVCVNGFPFIYVRMDEDGKEGWLQEVVYQYGLTPLEDAVNSVGCASDLPTRLQIGELAMIVEGIDTALRLRPSPTSFSESLGEYEPGATFTILSGFTCENAGTDAAFTFYQVRMSEDGQVGWLTETSNGRYVLEPVE